MRAVHCRSSFLWEPPTSLPLGRTGPPVCVMAQGLTVMAAGRDGSCPSSLSHPPFPPPPLSLPENFQQGPSPVLWSISSPAKSWASVCFHLFLFPWLLGGALSPPPRLLRILPQCVTLIHLISWDLCL